MAVYNKLSDFVDTGKPVVFETAVPSSTKVFIHVHAFTNPVTAWTWVDQDNLKWYVTSAEKGAFHLEPAFNRNFVLSQYTNSHDNDAPFNIVDKNTHPGDVALIRLIPLKNDNWLLQLVHSNKYVHLHGAYCANDTPITQWDYVDQTNLYWSIHEPHK